MHGKERSDGIFIFLTTRKKNSLFSAFTNIQLQCLIAWSKKTQVVIAYIQRLFLWEILVHFLSQTKHLIALECFTFFFFASYGLTETARTTVFVWRKSSDADYLGTLDVGASGGISVKALFFFSLHKHADCVYTIHRQECRSLLSEETFRISRRTKVNSTYCTLKALPPVSQHYTFTAKPLWSGWDECFTCFKEDLLCFLVFPFHMQMYVETVTVLDAHIAYMLIYIT